MPREWNWLLIVVGALMILLEVALGGFAGFDLVLIGSAILLGGAVGLWMQNAVVGLLIASALSVAYIVAGRRWVRSRLSPAHAPSNVDALLGQKAVVMTELAQHHPGQVKVRDEVWRAVPTEGAGPFAPGAVVTVQSVYGVTLQVR